MIALIIVCIMFIALVVCTIHSDYIKDKQYADERRMWHIERQQLLDRIQAPSYDHLKHHEAKIIKANKEPLKETNTLEVV